MSHNNDSNKGGTDHPPVDVELDDGGATDEVQEELDMHAAQDSFSNDNNWRAPPLTSDKALRDWHDLTADDQLNIGAIDEQSVTVAKSTEESYRR
jgi:hypothetical protein